jgi:hypothetical protein
LTVEVCERERRASVSTIQTHFLASVNHQVLTYKVAERVGLLAARDGRSSSASLRTDAFASSQNRSAIWSNPGGFVHTPRTPQ